MERRQRKVKRMTKMTVPTYERKISEAYIYYYNHKAKKIMVRKGSVVTIRRGDLSSYSRFTTFDEEKGRDIDFACSDKEGYLYNNTVWLSTPDISRICMIFANEAKRKYVRYRNKANYQLKLAKMFEGDPNV